jgi:hypothetical protein
MFAFIEVPSTRLRANKRVFGEPVPPNTQTRLTTDIARPCDTANNP